LVYQFIMSVLAVITTFFPEISVIQNIETIKNQADLTLIIDNGSDAKSLEFLQKFQKDPKVKIILNGQNLGIAKSCNIAAKFLLEHNQKVQKNSQKIQEIQKTKMEIEIGKMEIERENKSDNLIDSLVESLAKNQQENEKNVSQNSQEKSQNPENSQASKNQETNLTLTNSINSNDENSQKVENQVFDWLLTFDQDSTPDADYVTEMLKLADKIDKILEHQNKIGVICPTYFYKSTERLEKKNLTISDFCELNASMSSGSLIPKVVFEKGIFFEDKLFVDYFDLEFHLKLRKNGLKVLEASNIKLVHELGKFSKVSFLGKHFLTSNYPPFRRYYQARNRFLIYLRYFTFDPKSCFADLRNSLADIVKIILVEDQKLAKFSAVILGTLHGIINKYKNPAPKFK